MDTKTIDRIIKLLNEGNNETVIKILEDEKLMNELNKKGVNLQKYFERYMNNPFERVSVYGYVDDYFTFSDGVTYIMLKKPFIISDAITNSARRGIHIKENSQALLDVYRKIESYNTNVSEVQLSYCDEGRRLLAKSEFPDAYFLTDNVKKLNRFIMPEKLYINDEEIFSILSAESRKGKGYVLSLKNNQL